MSHSCKQSQSELNYWFTQEHEEALPEELRRQVTVCPECREHLKHHKEMMHFLLVEREDPVARLERSLWPQIEQRIKSQALSYRDQNIRSPGRLLSAERTNVWSQRIALASIAIALFAVFGNPILQYDRGLQSSQQNGSKPQFEFTRFEETKGNQQLPMLFGNKEYGLYRDVVFPGSGLNQKSSGTRFQVSPLIKDETESSNYEQQTAWGIE